MNRHTPHHRPGIILLVVISSLAFFSILIATYLVYSRDARQSSYNLAARNYRAPEVKDLLDESLMMLVRGTDDPFNPFYGEDLLSDYYGRTDAHELRVRPQNNSNEGSLRHIGGGYVRFPVQWRDNIGNWNATWRPNVYSWDDLYTGRLITFTSGPLQNRTFRVERSRAVDLGSGNWIDVLYFQLGPGLVADAILANSDPNAAVPALTQLFYPEANNTFGHTIHMNGAPRNSPGLGSDNNGNVTQTIGDLLAGSVPAIANLPVSLQPNRIRDLDTFGKVGSAARGDFDEDYDAADYFNWFLSYENYDGTVIPSFHRPAVINYILNQVNNGDWSTASAEQYRQGLASISRATFRPLPIAIGQLGNPQAIDEKFTGSSTKYALRTPLFPASVLSDPDVAHRRLDQLAKALIADPSDRRNQWDVDNTGDGIKDSIWIDLQLPTFTSPEGKLLKPLIAPRIEDLSARLNVNAHGNVTSNSDTPALSTALANWADTWAAFGTDTGTPHNVRNVFRGLGYGPAEIGLPAVSGNGTIHSAHVAALHSIITDRYSSRYDLIDRSPDPPLDARVPGRPGADLHDVLRTGWRPPQMTAGGGYGYSMDPFGRGGVAMGRSGHLVAAESGYELAAGASRPLDTINEAINDPYETDPTGKTGGDSLYSFAELEPLLRARDFDIDLLPQRLRERLVRLLEDHPEFAAVFTTYSKSDDSLVSANGDHLSAYVNLLRQLGSVLNSDQLNELVAPELRLGRKLDVNRPFGNGVDETPAAANQDGGGVIDEPREIPPGIWLPRTAGNPLEAAGNPPALVSAFNVNAGLPGFMEQQSFVDSTAGDQTIPNGYQTNPRYDFVQVDNYDPANPPAALIFELGIPATGRQVTPRQLLARHLYVLMMLLTREYTQFPTSSGVPDPSIDADYKARRIAQWAVNVVDYRDSDSIMTRFVFDPDPFDGWNPPAESDPDIARHVVWGVESPELIFSESLALHDVRVRKLDDEDEPEPRLYQLRKPEGSLFLELYCPRPQVLGAAEQSTKPGAPREFYNVLPNGVAELDLRRAAPPRPGATEGAPVWRIAISERHDEMANSASRPSTLHDSFPDTYSFDPDDPLEAGVLPEGAGPLKLERFIWFRDFADHENIANLIALNFIEGNRGVPMNPNHVFFAPSEDLREGPTANLNPMRQLQPGQYLTIAPRQVTHLGSRIHDGEDDEPPTQPSSHRFEAINGEGVIHYDHADQRRTPALAPNARYMPALPLIVGAFPPEDWESDTFEDGFIGLNVSEPLRDDYYQQTPLVRLHGDSDDNFPLKDAYYPYAASPSAETPFDLREEESNWRIKGDPMTGPTLGTINDYCTAFLQRLADPTIPYDPRFNPYRTVDSITIDLTVFSGEENPSDVGTQENYTRRSRQRHGRVVNTDNSILMENVLFSYGTNDPTDEPITLATTIPTGDFFAFAAPDAHVYTSLSFLNTNTSTPAGGPFPLSLEQQRCNFDFGGFAASIGSAPDGAPGVTGYDRNLPNLPSAPGLPSVPFARHPWLNRPFASHFELMMVPACSAGRLFAEFPPTSGSGNVPVYPGVASDLTTFQGRFRHLLNFFHSGRSDADAANFTRLFDFVHTLPRFNGEVEMIRPGRLNLAGTAYTGASNDPFFRTLLRPPFNMDYDNQRVGRINLNTVSQFPVWAGLMQGHLNQAEFESAAGVTGRDQLSFNRFVESRRGYRPSAQRTVIQGGNINYDSNNLSHQFPTQFVGAYRNAMSAMFTPAVSDAGATDIMRRREANATLLRTLDLAVDDPPNTAAETSQFVRAAGEAPIGPHLDRDRSAFLRYQTLMRMPNLVSDNSQLYLIRLTMGFFEVDANTGSLGREYNEDLGQNKRYKAMYIIDRSKEVGFIPGQDLNARDVVLYESYSQ